MFTGIIEELASISSLQQMGENARIVISCSVVTEDTRAGDSISVNGVCLTALDVTPTSFTADVSRETLERTTLGGLMPGSRVNLERAATPLTRLGGHIVQGHVDARGTFISAVKSGDFWTVKIGFPPEIARYLVFKGSVAVEGISLTVAKLNKSDLDIAVIPKTWEMTNLSHLNPGDPVNLEADVIAKYVERIMSAADKPADTVTREHLERAGFI